MNTDSHICRSCKPRSRILFPYFLKPYLWRRTGRTLSVNFPFLRTLPVFEYFRSWNCHFQKCLSLSLPWPNAGRKVDFPDRSDSFCSNFSDLYFSGTEEFRFSFKSFSWRSKMCNTIISDRSCTSGGFCPQLYLWLSLWSAKNLCPGYFTVNRTICSNFFCFCFIFYFYTQWSSPWDSIGCIRYYFRRTCSSRLLAFFTEEEGFWCWFSIYSFYLKILFWIATPLCSIDS